MKQQNKKSDRLMESRSPSNLIAYQLKYSDT